MATIEEQIKALEEQSARELKYKIERLKLSAEVGDAKKALQAQIKEETKQQQASFRKAEQELAKAHKELKSSFFLKYGEEFEPSFQKSTKTTLSLEEKAKLIGAKGYTLNDKSILVNAKGEPVTSTIVFKDANGDKQTLKASTFEKYLKDKK
jgi:aspartate carbamoyltransferase catalytic subunit